MSQIQVPYQCMVNCNGVLVAARGSSIDAFSLKDGSLLSTWNCLVTSNGKPEKPTSEATPPVTSLPETADVEDNAPPAKKRKLSNPSTAALPELKVDESSSKGGQPDAQRGKKKKQNNRSDAVSTGLEAPAVVTLAATSNGRYVIAVTGEDKSIRVFEKVEEGATQKLVQISQRAMPKRPCSITISTHDSTIICADKFGDVYSLPLIPTEPSAPASTAQTSEPSLPKTFVPAANELTIHSQRNRKALENQKKQGNQVSEKTGPTFEHTLLLGHVSMLTDIALVVLEGRNYIVTADRDEHIRVSRGVPQTHIIEGFCLGHTEFITRLCFPRRKSQFLISGGGDDDLFVWDWLAGKVVHRASLKQHVDALSSKPEATGVEGETSEISKMVVSGITSVGPTYAGLPDIILVTCEGVPAVFIFNLNGQGHIQYVRTISLPGNALALIGITEDGETLYNTGFVVSIDTFHKSGSTTERRDAGNAVAPLQSYKWDCGNVVEDGVVFAVGAGEDGVNAQLSAGNRLGNLLYTLENLRKREGDGRED